MLIDDSMFYQLLFIHLFRPFLKYKQAHSPLPAHVSPRKFLIHSATAISKLLRLYRRTYGLRQICNIVVYIAHTACTVHLLNLPDKNAQRDIQHGLNHLEEIAEGWLCARRTLGILHLVARRWKIELPEAAAKTFMRTDAKFGSITAAEHDFEQKTEHHASPPFSTPTPVSSLPPPSNAPPQQEQPDYQSQPIPSPSLSSFPPAKNLHHNPISTPEVPPSDISLNLPPQSSIPFNHQSQSYQYSMPQPVQDTWSVQTQSHPYPKRAARTEPLPPASQPPAAVTSPTMLFGGVQGLIQDQDWWLRDSNQFFANWNHGMDGSNGGAPGSVMNNGRSNGAIVDLGSENGNSKGNGQGGGNVGLFAGDVSGMNGYWG